MWIFLDKIARWEVPAVTLKAFTLFAPTIYRAGFSTVVIALGSSEHAVQTFGQSTMVDPYSMFRRWTGVLPANTYNGYCFATGAYLDNFTRISVSPNPIGSSVSDLERVSFRMLRGFQYMRLDQIFIPATINVGRFFCFGIGPKGSINFLKSLFAALLTTCASRLPRATVMKSFCPQSKGFCFFWFGHLLSLYLYHDMSLKKCNPED